MRSVSVRLADLDKVKLNLGFVGENEHTHILFDCKKAFEQYPNAVPSMVVVPPKGDSYPAVVTREGDIVEWIVTDSDLIHHGDGEIQLQFKQGDVIMLSCKTRTSVAPSCYPKGTIPTPIQNWIAQANAILAEIPDDINSALSAAKASGEFDGDDGVGIASIAKTGTSGLVDTYTITLTDGNHYDIDVTNGTPGQNGVGIQNIAKTSTVGLVDTYTITLTNGDSYPFTVTNGQNGVEIDDTTPAVNKVFSSSKVDQELTDVKNAIQGISGDIDAIINGEKRTGISSLDISNPDGKQIVVSVTPDAEQTILFYGDNLADITEGQFEGIATSVPISCDPATGTVETVVDAYNSRYARIDKFIEVENDAYYMYSASYSPSNGSASRLLIRAFDSNKQAVTEGVEGGTYISAWGGCFYKDTKAWKTKFASNIKYVKIGFVFMSTVGGTSYVGTKQNYSGMQFEKSDTATAFKEGRYEEKTIEAATKYRMVKGNNHLRSTGTFTAEWSIIGGVSSAEMPVNSEMDNHDALFKNDMGEVVFSLKNVNSYVSVKGYGAVGDGINDDTVAIQNALDNNKCVYFPNGTYKITDTIVLGNGNIIIGESRYSTIIKAVGCSALEIDPNTAKQGSIKEIKIEGNTTDDTNGITFTNASENWCVEDVWIKNFTKGISNASGHVNNIYIKHAMITDCGYGIYMPGNSLQQVNIVSIYGCDIYNCTTGILITGQAHSLLYNTIQYCDFGIVLDCTEIEFTGDDIENCNSITIMNTYMERIKKSCIHVVTKKDSELNSNGAVYGLFIVSNYFNRDFASVDNDYATVWFETKTNNPVDKNVPNPASAEASCVIIANNRIVRTSNSTPIYDLETLQKDSVLMDISTMASTQLNANDNVNNVKVIGVVSKGKVSVPWAKGFTGNNTVTDDDVTIASGSSASLYIGKNDIISLDSKLSTNGASATYTLTVFGIKKSDGVAEQLMQTTDTINNNNYSLSVGQNTIFASKKYSDYSDIKIVLSVSDGNITVDNPIITAFI